MILPSPVVGVRYPGNLAAVRSWFPDEEACLDYLDWLRWPDDFCWAKKGWRLPEGGAVADVGTDQGLEPTPQRDAPTARAEVARKPCSRLT